MIWNAATNVTVRYAFTQSLAGASLDQSVRLEPAQVSGFNQAYRSLIPENLEAANSAAGMNTMDLALERKFGSRTYGSLSGQWLKSSVARERGAFGFDPSVAFLAQISSVSETLRYDERSLHLFVNRIVDDQWALGLGYRYTHTRLQERLLGVPEGLTDNTTSLGVFQPQRTWDADLHEGSFQCIFNHPSGVFSRTEWVALLQQTEHSLDGPSDSYHWQQNITLGWRFPRHRAEISASVLNLWNQAYHLQPISPIRALPAERLLVLSARLRF